GKATWCPSIALVRDLGAPGQAGHAPPQFTPGLPLFRVVLSGPPNLELLRMVDGGFDPQDAALFVVELEGVAVDKMFDPQAFRPVLEAAVEFPRKFAHPVG